MKKILNPKFKKESKIEIEESSSKEDVQSKKIDGMISQALENIEGNIKLIPDLPMRKFVDKGKKAISKFSEGTSRENLGEEKDMEYMHVQYIEHFVEGQGVPLGEILVE